MRSDALTENVRARVARRFPELGAVTPTVERAGAHWVYTFRGSVAVAPGGPVLRQVVRVTVDKSGRIVKMVASR